MASSERSFCNRRFQTPGGFSRRRSFLSKKHLSVKRFCGRTHYMCVTRQNGLLKPGVLRAEIPRSAFYMHVPGGNQFSVSCVVEPQRTRVSGPGLFRDRTLLTGFPEHRRGSRFGGAGSFCATYREMCKRSPGRDEGSGSRNGPEFKDDNANDTDSVLAWHERDWIACAVPGDAGGSVSAREEPQGLGERGSP